MSRAALRTISQFRSRCMYYRGAHISGKVVEAAGCRYLMPVTSLARQRPLPAIFLCQCEWWLIRPNTLIKGYRAAPMLAIS